MRRLNRAQLLGIALALVLASVALLYGVQAPNAEQGVRSPDAGQIVRTPDGGQAASSTQNSDEISFASLPPQAQHTVKLIRAGGPFPYPRDGVRFGNYEGRLPHKHPNFYREYTVQTPGISSRGARRIVAGQDGTFYYTADHYESFRRVVP
ncbi:MAG TPA: ribonuclease domain-containing protein [Marmoricola sp.]|mgnify:CR=1 FL=1|jgi:ribonuclease T1|nr:ribonuclease N1 [Nocardioidaceae bacterium]MCB8993619.1 ribonuclease [Nocardioidaceae bacterium]MCO5324534.1 ribonuclease N1 [Nocardioidaceae bacterium]HRV69456.1 ribonuclease domain-containing protein [Marmoricola sp.]